MPLSMNSAISANDIVKIGMYKELKVFYLKGKGTDKLVVKTDAVHAPQYKSANVAIKAIDHGVRVKILTDNERAALKEYIDTWEWMDAYYSDLKKGGLKIGGLDDDERDAVKSMKDSLTFGFPFVKMEAQNLRDLEGALAKRSAGDKADLQAFTDSLTAQGGLEKLGYVVAADLFNGNTDRFFPGTDKHVTIGKYSIHLKALVNVGNVFIVVSQGQFKVSALDFVDPNSRFKNMNVSLADLEGTSREDQWPGRVLVDKKRRHKFAEDIIHDLEKILHPKKHALSLTTKLGSNAAKRLDAGMVGGAIAIRNKLHAKYHPDRWTTGARERFTLLQAVR